MALVLRRLADLYFYLNDEVSDPRVKTFWLMSNPFPMGAVVVLYLFFVLRWGPKWMESRKPFNLDKIMIVYNVIQIIACIYLVVKGIAFAYPNKYSLLCQPVDYAWTDSAIEIATGVHFYFILKIVDLLDTVFFVLRKKNNQISFLHVYHHAGMVILTWNATKFFAGGQSVFTGFINSIIHVVMYTYYLVTAFSAKYKSNVWWKKYITQMQIIQFFMITAHWSSLLIHEDCGYPRWPVAIMIPQNFFMLALFGDFYRKAYLNKKPKSVVNGTLDKSKEELCKQIQNNNNDNINNNNNINYEINKKNEIYTNGLHKREKPTFS